MVKINDLIGTLEKYEKRHGNIPILVESVVNGAIPILGLWAEFNNDEPVQPKTVQRIIIITDEGSAVSSKLL